MHPPSPLVSILIVTWNRRRELARAIESALAQTVANKEVVVLDNASTDGTIEMVHQNYPGVYVVGAPRNLGCPSGRNLGFRHCRGAYIYLLDDDGWLKEDAVELCLRRMESDPAIGVVMARIHEVEDGRLVKQHPVGQEEAGYRSDFIGCCSLVRRTALDAAGVFPEGYDRQGEETDLALRLLEAGYFCYHEPTAVMFHGRSPIGRDPRAIQFYTLRNSNRTALRRWPMPWCALRPLASLRHSLAFAWNDRHLALPVRVLASLAWDVGRLPGQRVPVSRATFQLFKQLERAPVSERPAKYSEAARPGTAVADPAKPATCAVLVDRIGPYHFARLTALAARMRTVAIESFGMDATYAWSKVSGQSGFERYTLMERAGGGRAQERCLMARVADTLTRIAPSVVAIPGWSEKSALVALRWCLRTGTPALVLSATFEAGRPRVSWKEAIKRRVVRLFSAGLGGGAPQTGYLERLGIPRANLFAGYDVVDNRHFAVEADAARDRGDALRQSLGLPAQYFLSICRFVEEKNLDRLLRAYAAYRARAGASAWKLVLLGDGPLKAAITAQRDELGLPADVLLPGFKQYPELPQYYGLAGAFVLPSLTEPWGLVVNEAMAAGLPVVVSDRCGCASDLVRPGENGFTFDPCDVGQLAALLGRVSAADTDRPAMGEASRRIIASWTPEVFAARLQHAAAAACAAPRPSPGWLDRMVLWLLLQRGKEAA
jgi:GT2 family glycosyltransferase/glycosyltransferase involved in cell wall biosynthesis